MITINRKDNSYKGIWYCCGASNDEYVYKYSGGLGTYPANHQPFAVYRPEVNKTFFCYGGTDEDGQLLHMVSYYDHAQDLVPKPTIVLNKKTEDAHDNPVIQIDEEGYIWLFSTSHGTGRPSYIHRSVMPYTVDEFELVRPEYLVEGEPAEMTNFSYMQSWHIPGEGFACFFTRYNYPAQRTNCFMTSSDGYQWSQWQRLAAIDEGHYQVSAVLGKRAATMFNYHPRGKGLDYRTNLYYMETSDMGKAWQSIDHKQLEVPLTEVDNPALVHDYRTEGLNVYTIDLQFDHQQRPVLLYITSPGYQSGPTNDPRTWTIAHWLGDRWQIKPAMTSDSNYDFGSLYIDGETWTIIAPTETGPQPYNPGGEIALWVSRDFGHTWKKERQLTSNSPYNHTYLRRPVNAHPDFYGFWADGNPRQQSPSRLYFCDQQGNVRILPEKMDTEFARPATINRS